MFENKWTLREDFVDNTKGWWELASNAQTLPEKLEVCGNLVSKWAEEKVGNTKRKIGKLINEID